MSWTVANDATRTPLTYRMASPESPYVQATCVHVPAGATTVAMAPSISGE